jgi:hypothetical protein
LGFPKIKSRTSLIRWTWLARLFSWLR